MPSSNHRSSSTHSSRRTQTDRRLPSSRSASVPHRQFVIVLTNNSELLRHTLALQPQTGQRTQSTVPVQNAVPNNGTANNNNREEILSDLLRVELREVARDFLSRTHRSYPIHYVFNMSDIELPQQL